MNSKIKLAIALVASIYFITACNNRSARTDDKKDSSTLKTSTMEKDSMNMDNGMMASMNAMMDKMSGMKMSGDFDMDLANMMIEHHQGAIDMSKIEVAKGMDEKMKGMAQNIITKQTEEIGMLREIIQNFKVSGMKHGEGTLQKIHSEMKTATSGMQMTGSTDKDYATMMVSHHESAVKMFKAQLTNGRNDKLKQMAKKGIADQTKEIAEFKAWLSGNK